jgi:hypothetical protein
MYGRSNWADLFPPAAPKKPIEPVRRIATVLSRNDRPKARKFKPRRAMVIVTWRRSDRRNWWTLNELKLSDVFDTGVYIVWYRGNPGRVVCVGQGAIAQELARLRANEEVTRFGAHSPLLVTWAPVSPGRIDGVERYITDTWPPLVDGPHPDVSPIEVNSPWLPLSSDERTSRAGGLPRRKPRATALAQYPRPA